MNQQYLPIQIDINDGDFATYQYILFYSYISVEFTLQPIACVGSDVCDVSLSIWLSVHKLALGQMKDEGNVCSKWN